MGPRAALFRDLPRFGVPLLRNPEPAHVRPGKAPELKFRRGSWGRGRPSSGIFRGSAFRSCGMPNLRNSGEGGIRTLDERITTRNALAGRRLQPLGHLSKVAQDIGRSGRLPEPAPNARLPYAPYGGVPERSNGAVSKTVKGASSSRVQIPAPPLTDAGSASESAPLSAGFLPELSTAPPQSRSSSRSASSRNRSPARSI